MVCAPVAVKRAIGIGRTFSLKWLTVQLLLLTSKRFAHTQALQAHMGEDLC